MTPDAKDKQILALLQLNARLPTADIARQVHLARSTVQERIKRMEQAGLIEGYAVKLNADLLPKIAIQSRVALSVKASHFNNVIRALELMPEVLSCETVSGQFDLMLKAQTTSPDKHDQLVERIGELNGVERTESSIILREFFKRSI
ncbi:Lrp/AsnC family transcriptional regulator [Marinomonas sp. PE14-40]|uniref:Lrp/AsnC family transcriptional regulator n=1 Tax=Marinomonas sp. PE14-40 TaxID=3060621 RepID=UPI003F6757AB